MRNFTIIEPIIILALGLAVAGIASRYHSRTHELSKICILRNPFSGAFGLILDLSIKLVQLVHSAFYEGQYFKIRNCGHPLFLPV